MEIELNIPETEITGKDISVETGNTNIAVLEDTKDLDITYNRKEYSIIGDGIFISSVLEDVPEWLGNLIDSTFEAAILSRDQNLINRMEAILTAMDYVPKNRYTEQINQIVDEDGIINTRIATLNSNLTDALTKANATIAEIDLTYASKDEASAIATNVITASLSADGEIGSTLIELQNAYADLESTTAESITLLESVMEGEINGNASAMQTIRSYIGINEAGASTGLGTLDIILNNIQNQVDGSISTWFYDAEPTLVNLPASEWTTTETRNIHLGDIYYDRLTGFAYRFAFEDIDDTPDAGVIYTWIRITDSDITKALADAAQAQETADGKITTYYQSSTPIAEGIGDIWIDSDDGNKMYRWNGSTWGSDLVGTMVASSQAITTLQTNLNSTNITVSGHTTQLNTVDTRIANGVATVDSKWQYNSNLIINGVPYNSGFGLATSLEGEEFGIPVGTSEFWINAEKFKFTNTNKTGSVAPFTIDTSESQPQITFNGKVTFGSGQVGTIDQAIAAVVETVAVGDKNINITDNLIPTASLVADTDNSGYQFIGTPIKSMSAGLESFSEAQIILDGSDEAYSPYVDEVTIPYYYRFGIKGITNLDRFKVVTINASNVVTYNNVTVTMEVGKTLSTGNWYTVDGIINPLGGTTTADGDIRDINGVKVGSINNFVIPVGTTKVLLGWIADCTISRMKMCKITADTITSDFSSVNGQLTNLQSQIDNVDVSWNSLSGKDIFAQKLGYATYAALESAATAGETVVVGGKINTGLIEANAINANQINTTGLIAENISADTIAGKTITGGRMYGTYIEGAIIKASFIDLSSTATLTNWQQYTPATYPSAYDANFAKNNNGTLLVDSQGYVRLMGNTKIVTPAVVYNSNYAPNSGYTPAVSIPPYEINIHGQDDYKYASLNRMISDSHTLSINTAQKITIGSLNGIANTGSSCTCSLKFYVFEDYYEMYLYGSQNRKSDWNGFNGYIKKNSVIVASTSHQYTAMTYTLDILGIPFTLNGAGGSYGSVGISAVSTNNVSTSTIVSCTNKYNSVIRMIEGYCSSRMYVSADIPVMSIV